MPIFTVTEITTNRTFYTEAQFPVDAAQQVIEAIKAMPQAEGSQITPVLTVSGTSVEDITRTVRGGLV